MRADRAPRLAAARLAWIHRLLPREPARFHGPRLYHRVARTARAVPVSDDGRAAVGGDARPADHAARGGGAPALVRRHRVRLRARRQSRRRPHGDAHRRRAGLRQRVRVRVLPGRRGRRDRAPGQLALHRVGDARVVRVRPRPFRADARSRLASPCRRRSTRCRSRWPSSPPSFRRGSSPRLSIGSAPTRRRSSDRSAPSSRSGSAR